MMITKQDAMTESRFHRLGACTKTVGPRGGITHRVVEVRRNGQTRTWITRPEEFAVPIKYGLYEYGVITAATAEEWVVASECPVCNPEGAWLGTIEDEFSGPIDIFTTKEGK